VELKIISKYDGLSISQFAELLKRQIKLNINNIVLEIRTPRRTLRGLDPSILVAIVGTTGTALGALISGILQVLKLTSMKKIVLQTKSGSRIEVPADISPKDLDILIQKIKKLDSKD